MAPKINIDDLAYIFVELVLCSNQITFETDLLSKRLGVGEAFKA